MNRRSLILRPLVISIVVAGVFLQHRSFAAASNEKSKGKDAALFHREENLIRNKGECLRDKILDTEIRLEALTLKDCEKGGHAKCKIISSGYYDGLAPGTTVSNKEPNEYCHVKVVLQGL